MDKHVIVPTAKVVPLELQVEFGRIPSGMVPLNGKPVLHSVLQAYAEQGFRSIAAVHENASAIGDYISDHPGLLCTPVDVGPTSSLGQTVLHALDALPDTAGQVIIHFADTIVRKPDCQGDWACYAERNDGFRWTAFEIQDGRIEKIWEKGSLKSYPKPMPVFVGLFSISDLERFGRDLRAVLDAECSVDPFYLALQKYLNHSAELEPATNPLVEVEEWYDFGHLDTYYESRRLFSRLERHFNQIHVDSNRGLIRKQSQNARKLRQEILWYLHLPKSLHHIRPRIFDYDLDPTDPFVEMEYYGYPTLNDIFLYSSCELDVWEQIFQALSRVMDEMAQFCYRPAEKGQIKRVLQSMYLDKTRQRLEPVLQDPRFAEFSQDAVLINGTRCLGLKAALDVLPSLLESSGIYQPDSFSVIHGDLCFSNLLFDRRNGLVRLIDPRGDFGGLDIYGDPRYDYAKLSHSVHGNYDFIVNNLFELSVEEGAVNLHCYLRDEQRRVKALFNRWLGQQMIPEQIAAVDLIESLLFLSMVPLHSDRPDCQKAFLAKGLHLFSRAADQAEERT